MRKGLVEIVKGQAEQIATLMEANATLLQDNRDMKQQIQGMYLRKRTPRHPPPFRQISRRFRGESKSRTVARTRRVGSASERIRIQIQDAVRADASPLDNTT